MVATTVSVEHKFETYLERDRKEWPRQGFGSNRNSKHTSSMIENYFEHGRNISRARPKHISSTVETYLEHGRARSKHTLSMVEKYRFPRISIENKVNKKIFFHKSTYFFLFSTQFFKLQTSISKD